jgi:hypothetical protein
MIFKASLEVSLLNYVEEAHHSLVMAAKIAHLEKHPEAQNISKLIDQLEEIISRLEN